MIRITSSSNEKIRRLVLLRQKTKVRRESRSFVIEGERLVLDTPAEYLQEIYVTEKARKRMEPELQQAERTGTSLFIVSEEVMQKASDTQTPQGILAVVRQPEWILDDMISDSPLLLILEDIQDPGNLGTMFRTAEAAGATGIIMSRGTVDVFNPKTVRATMSSIFRVPFLVTDDLQQELQLIRRKTGARIYAAMPATGSICYDKADYREPSAFLIGNEGNGLKPSTAAEADQRITIPMDGEIESLNAAMSAGILLYEAARQRRNSRS